MRRRDRSGRGSIAIPIVVLVIGVAAVAAAALLRAGSDPEVRATISLADALGAADTAGYVRATGPREFAFPADHGPHPGFRTEWWYFTGHLEDARGRRFGYHLTFFRNALGPDSVQRRSAWAADHAFMAHFAITDVEGRQFHAGERFARAALGLAGARLEPFQVWTGDWSATATGAQVFPLRLRAERDEFAIDLRLERGKPPVLQGVRGLSRKGPEPGNASYYYSLPRMPTTGAVRVGGDTLRVVGSSWMDREWSTSALSAGLVGWDWFALQLEDSSELMFYRLRTRDGLAAPFSEGSLIAPDGSSVRLTADDVLLDVLDTWRSEIDRTVYPARWRIRVPSASLDLDVRPLLADQELDLAVRYWEGAVAVRGTRDAAPMAGRGYVELTGYTNAPPRSRRDRAP